MKPIWIFVACAACFLIGCNVGEERVKAKVRSALKDVATRMESGLSAFSERTYDDFQIPRQVERTDLGPPQKQMTREEMTRMLIEKEREMEAREMRRKSQEQQNSPQNSAKSLRQ